MSTARARPFHWMLLFFLFSGCERDGAKPASVFEDLPQISTVDNSIREASGVAASIINPGLLWVHEDSGNPNRLLLVKNDGSLLKSIVIHGATNLDWEDMAISKGPNAGINYLYIADVGDNSKARTESVIYRFPEPQSSADTVHNFEKIHFSYPDGPHDAEAILVAPSTKDIYIITKSDNPSIIYKMAFPQSLNTLNQAVMVGKLRVGTVTGAAMSSDGSEIIVKTYSELHYFSIKTGETVESALNSASVSLGYQVEPQGEAVSFTADRSGFYTISEKGPSAVVNLSFYKRK